MKKSSLLVASLTLVLASCTVANPLFPEDALDISKYRDPIVVDWTNDYQSEPSEEPFADPEILRTYLNQPRLPIREVEVFTNVFLGAGALRLGQNRRDHDAELTFTLKDDFCADAIALSVYPYHYEIFDYSSGKNETIYESFSVSVNGRGYVDILPDDKDEPRVLTFAFIEVIDEISILTSGRCGFLIGLSIYQK